MKNESGIQGEEFPTPIRLLDALDMADREDPWRKPFRIEYWDHP